MESLQRSTIVSLVVTACLASAAVAQTRKEFRYTVAPHTQISVDTQYGGITVRPGTGNQVIAVAVIQSNKVEVDGSQQGNRIMIGSHLLPGADAQTGRVDYELTVPPNSALDLHSSTGPLSVQGIQGDMALEGASAPVDVRNVNSGHLHVKTMNGPVTVSDVHNGHVEITTISGDIRLTAVTGPLVEVSSTSGKISYNGDFGSGGDYNFVTHTGDIEALVPADASADVKAHSVQGKVQNDFPLEAKGHARMALDTGRSFVGTMGKAASQVVLRSFSGKIRLKQR